MNDKELLENAAKAAGIEIVQEYVEPAKFRGLLLKSWKELFLPSFWNPLVDDGDALRLALSVGMVINIWEGEVIGSMSQEIFEKNDGASLRRAIVRAAAAIGETME